MHNKEGVTGSIEPTANRWVMRFQCRVVKVLTSQTSPLLRSIFFSMSFINHNDTIRQV